MSIWSVAMARARRALAVVGRPETVVAPALKIGALLLPVPLDQGAGVRLEDDDRLELLVDVSVGLPDRAGRPDHCLERCDRSSSSSAVVDRFHLGALRGG